MKDLIDRSLQQVAVMADHDQGTRITGHVIFQPERSFQIEVSIANQRLKLRSGMIATVQAGSAGVASQQVQIPVDALVHDPISGHYLVYGTEQRAGRIYAKEISVRPGLLSGSYVKIVEGLKPGQKIVASGASLLRPGDPIQEVE